MCSRYQQLYLCSGRRGNKRTIQVYSAVNNVWNAHRNILSADREWASVVAVDDKLIVYGGYPSSKTLDVVLTNEHECALVQHELPQLYEGRRQHASVAIDNTVYVLGGSNDHISSSCESINTDDGTHRRISRLIVGRRDCAAATHHRNIIVCGGLDENLQSHSSVEMYTEATDNWTLLAPMKFTRRWHCAVIINDEMIIIGGNTHSIETYNITTQEARITRSTDVVGRYHFIAAVVEVDEDDSGELLKSLLERRAQRTAIII